MRQAMETRKPISNGQLGCAPPRMESQKFCMWALGSLRAMPVISLPSFRLTFWGLGLAYATGRGAPIDQAEAFVWLTLASEQGSTGKDLGILMSSMSPDV